jgi:hypothetical protein
MERAKSYQREPGTILSRHEFSRTVHSFPSQLACHLSPVSPPS